MSIRAFLRHIGSEGAADLPAEQDNFIVLNATLDQKIIKLQRGREDLLDPVGILGKLRPLQVPRVLDAEDIHAGSIGKHSNVVLDINDILVICVKVDRTFSDLIQARFVDVLHQRLLKLVNAHLFRFIPSSVSCANKNELILLSYGYRQI